MSAKTLTKKDTMASILQFVTNPPPLDPGRVTDDGQCYEVGMAMTLDGYGELITGRMVVATGIDSVTHLRVYSWELRSLTGGPVLSRGEWSRSMFDSWKAAERFLRNPACVLYYWRDGQNQENNFWEG